SPWARHQLYRAELDGRPQGYFFLAITMGHARLADWWTASQDPDDWLRLCSLAVATARQEPEDLAMTAMSSHPLGTQALVDCGFRVYEKLPVTFFGSKALLDAGLEFHIQMIDADFSFLHENRLDFWV